MLGIDAENLVRSREPDDAARWKKLGAILDVERFASFLAIEALLGVGDGYDFGRNNYRIYHDPITKLLSFIGDVTVNGNPEAKGYVVKEVLPPARVPAFNHREPLPPGKVGCERCVLAFGMITQRDGS